MYEVVHVGGSRTTPARFASTAAEYGYDGIVVRGEITEAACDRIGVEFDIDVVRGAVVAGEDRNEVAQAIASTRATAEIVSGTAPDERMQRFLAQREHLDTLNPDGTIPHTIAKLARDHGIAIEIDLGPVLRERGTNRVSAMRTLRRVIRIVDHYDLPYVIGTNPSSHLELRAPRELMALGPYLGFDTEAVEAGLERWGELARRARRARDDRFIEPGVERVADDADDR